MINEIPTLEKFLWNQIGSTLYQIPELQIILKYGKQYTELHVKAALEAADKKLEDELPEGFWEDIDDKNFILNSYPLTNIK